MSVMMNIGRENIMEREKLLTMLGRHALWLLDKDGGERIDQTKANLCGADLREAILCKANLREANLFRANLFRANLFGANLRKAVLCKANLSRADLRLVDLNSADLAGADLSGTDLRDAVLYQADLCGANLCGANMYGANLCKANLQETIWDYGTIGLWPAPEGDLIGWSMKSGHIVKMLIPADAPRSCGTTRKFRAAWVKVLEIDDGATNCIEHKYKDVLTVYKVGQIVRADSWDSCRWNECSHGIHFFLTREEAEAWIE